jgi:hypothetical protein
MIQPSLIELMQWAPNEATGPVIPSFGMKLKMPPTEEQNAMPVFRLFPVVERLDDPSWAASRFKEVCWIIARDEADARLQLQSIALRMVDVVPGRKFLYSPWLSVQLTQCTEDGFPPVSMKEGIVWTISGKTYS